MLYPMNNLIHFYKKNFLLKLLNFTNLDYLHHMKYFVMKYSNSKTIITKQEYFYLEVFF